MARITWCVLLLALGLVSCNQPFTPDAPGTSRLVMYSVLNRELGTQYVRLETTYPTDPVSPPRNATVRMKSASGIVQFRDTVITYISPTGATETMPLYVANNVSVVGGQTYTLEATTSSGLAAQATSTALLLPEFYLKSTGNLLGNGIGPIALAATFGSATGAWESHFFIEFYALIDGGWELRREEVPLSVYYDNAGKLVKVYSRLSPVPFWASANAPLVVEFDTTLYQNTRIRISQTYSAAEVVFMYAVFSLTQVDNTLYSYYYIANGLEDKTSIRLDAPEFTNIAGGVGVFGSSARVYKRFTLRK
jgi:hypothetical protein